MDQIVSVNGEHVLDGAHFVDLVQAAARAGEPVPVSLRAGDGEPVLVISGPNTGGKTVALKTVGLLALMAQCGLHVPAAPGSRLPVFRRVYADIGDDQSIAENLSTFSAHLAAIVEMTRDLERPALVLLDEVGELSAAVQVKLPSLALLSAMAITQSPLRINSIITPLPHSPALQVMG